MTHGPRILFTVLLLSACSLSREPIAAVRLTDAGGGLDAPGPIDLDAPAPASDAPIVPTDAPATSVDAPIVPIDAPACTPGCVGSVLWTCTGAPVDCAASGQVCDPGTLRCVMPPCVDTRPMCSPDGRVSTVCMSGMRVPTYCDGYGCDTGTGTCDATCMIAGEYVPGTIRFDVCSFDADYENATGAGCNTGADDADRLARLVVTRRSHLDAVLRDDDAVREVDVVLYLREVCDDRDRQIVCDDDVPCAEAPSALGACFGGNQWRQAHITADLEPGTYYLVADSIRDFANGIDWECGDVELTVALTPL